MEFLNNILENTQAPFITAFVLGLMTAISPCPMATNITAIGYIGKDITNKRKVFINGLVYTGGRGIAYVLLGLLFYLGASHVQLSSFFQEWGEKILGPALIVLGLFMLDLIHIPIPGFTGLNKKMEEKAGGSIGDVLLIGIVFALAFCPYSGVLFFGMLIPITISSASGLYLPAVFALATGIPVIIAAWIIAFSLSSIGTFYQRLKNFEYWFRRIIAVLFIGVGFYYCVMYFL